MVFQEVIYLEEAEPDMQVEEEEDRFIQEGM